MNGRMVRRIALLLAVSATIAGCEGKPPAAQPSEAVAMGPERPLGITLGEARIQLPVVAGRPGAAYFTLTQNGGTRQTIAAVHVAGAGRAEMHRTSQANGVSRMEPVATVPLDPDAVVRFAPGGNHVMLFDLDPALKAGGTAEITVSFANGDKVSAPASVAAGGGDMEHMH